MSEQDASGADVADDDTTDAEGEDGDRGGDGDSREIPFLDVETDIDGVDVDGEVDESLVEHVEESGAESVARELAALQTRVEALAEELDAREEELDEVTSKLKRKQADFQNYKKRMEKRREQERERATEDLVERLLDVRDNLARALDQDDPDAEDLLGGVEKTLQGFDRVFEEEDVTVVEPDPGDDVDPRRHEVLVRVDSDQPPETIADVHRPGYVMAGKVVRPAQVTVSDGSGADDDAADE